MKMELTIGIYYERKNLFVRRSAWQARPGGGGTHCWWGLGVYVCDSICIDAKV
jgi:hypothetical protein